MGYATAPDPESVSTGRMILGLIAAAVVGLLAYLLVITLAAYVDVGIAVLLFGKDWPHQASEPFRILPFYLVFGLPLSIIFCLMIGLPVWKYAESRPLRSRRDAARLGALAGALIGLLFLAFNLLVGLSTYYSDSSSYDSWHWGYQVTRDGMPTLFGWVFEVLSVVYFAMAGVFGGLAARMAAVPRERR